ncbi:MAG TPA: heparan-alpha-glucosaminide N-acetyltransferase domain-containing protein [Cyclobacteriaceae bacterium]|nr:heparan-alpha-glucosaminide N-acetyltransferase domain-containing protein [Cyclobacteriaceae bacterium]
MQSNRSLSIDVLRGLTVAVMIVVNSPGSWEYVYGPLLHAQWNGFTLTDWVFPSFLFVVGNSMSFSLDKYRQLGTSAFFTKVAKRTALIFLIGYLLLWFPFFRHNAEGEIYLKSIDATRIFGVLQRIALCYFIASVMIYYLSERATLILSAVVLFAYHLLLVLFGDLTLAGNAVLKFDLWMVGDTHMYHGEGLAFDPEGFLSTLPAVINVIGGYWAGVFLRKNGPTYETIAKMMVIGMILIFAGFAWDIFLPFNKKIWTSSYVLLTIGINLNLLALLVFVIDLQQKRRWTYFFDVFGKNTLFIYVASSLITDIMLFFSIGDNNIYDWFYVVVFQPIFGNYLGSFLFALAFLLMCWLLGLWMDKKKIYIKI